MASVDRFWLIRAISRTSVPANQPGPQAVTVVGVSDTHVTVDGNWEKLLEDMRGFHWMMVYGDCCREVGYAIRKLGIDWENVSA